MQQINRVINAKLDDSNTLYSIEIQAEKIIAVITQGSAIDTDNGINDSEADSSEPVINAQGQVLLPGLIDIHTHIDKSFTDTTNGDGTLISAIQSMQEIKQLRSLDTLLKNAERAVRASIKQGVCLLRSHIDLSSESDLDAVAALLDLKKYFSRCIELEFTALGGTGTQTELNLMHSALELGIDMIGGAPSLSASPEKSIINAIQLSKEWQRGLDLHIDEKESTETIALEILADECLKQNVREVVIASHCCTLAFLNENARQRVLLKVKRAGIGIVSLPSCNLVLMGRQQQPVPRGIAPIKKIQAAGIPLCIGSDNVRDPFNPFGNYDPLTALTIACMASHLNSYEDIIESIKLVTDKPANILRKTSYGIAEGAWANLCLTNAKSLHECVVSTPEKRACIYRGKLTYEKRVQEYCAE